MFVAEIKGFFLMCECLVKEENTILFSMYSLINS